MTDAICRLTAKNRDELRNPTLGEYGLPVPFTFCVLCTCEQVSGSNSAAHLDVGKRSLVSAADKGDTLAQTGIGSLSDNEKFQLMLQRLKML